jgi:DNA-binding transcriptional ArsR family regulator
MEPMSEEVLRVLADRFKLLANPTRLGILQHICEKEMRVGELVEATDFKQANVSKQLSLLHQAGLVQRRVDGTHVYYTVADDSLPRLCRIIREGLISRERELLRKLDLPDECAGSE